MNHIDKDVFLGKYNKEFDILLKNIVQLLVNFRNSLELSPTDHPKYLIRNSIIYRFESIRFHLLLLLNIYHDVSKLLADGITDQIKDNHNIFLSGRDRMLFIFDDIVFNSASLLDYYGKEYLDLHLMKTTALVNKIYRNQF